MTAIVGLTAFVLIFCNGVAFGKPGEPDSEISFGIGWYLGLAPLASRSAALPPAPGRRAQTTRGLQDSCPEQLAVDDGAARVASPTATSRSSWCG